MVFSNELTLAIDRYLKAEDAVSSFKEMQSLYDVVNKQRTSNWRKIYGALGPVLVSIIHCLMPFELKIVECGRLKNVPRTVFVQRSQLRVLLAQSVTLLGAK